jgi:hypothetical protein
MTTNKVTSYDAQLNGKNYGGEKEMDSALSVVACKDGQMKEVICCRTFMGRSKSSSVVYASLWIYAGDNYAAGNGKAGGYGYHKRSAAIECAINSAGIRLDQSIDGAGDTAVSDALEAIAKHLGFDNVLVVSHGT